MQLELAISVGIGDKSRRTAYPPSLVRYAEFILQNTVIDIARHSHTAVFAPYGKARTYSLPNDRPFASWPCGKRVHQGRVRNRSGTVSILLSLCPVTFQSQRAGWRGASAAPAPFGSSRTSHSLLRIIVARCLVLKAGQFGRPWWLGFPLRAKATQALLILSPRA